MLQEKYGYKQILQFCVITLITLTSVLGITSIPPAFPAIAKNFNLPLDKIGILMGVFTMPGIILTPIYGYLADKYSRKAVLIPSLLLFTLAGLACSFATSFQMLVVFRLLQGIGVAPLGALNISLIGDIFAPEDRSKYTGYNSSVLSLGTAFFPLIGGFMALISWNSVFYLSFLGLLTVVLYMVVFRNTGKNESNINLKEIIESIKDKEFRKIIFFNLLSYFVIIGTLFTYLPFHLKYTFNFQSDKIGIYLFIMSVVAAVSATLLHYFVKKIGEENLVKIQFLLFGASLVSLPYMDEKMILLPIICLGAAYGINFPNMQFWVLKITPQSKRASITAVHRAVSQIGQTSGPILTGVLLSKISVVNSVINAFYFGAVISFIALVISLLILKSKKHSTNI